jgi:hypothetical protein
VRTTRGPWWPTVVLTLSLAVLAFADVTSWLQHRSGYPSVVAPWLEASTASVAYGVVGWFISRRVPENRLGPVMLVGSCISSVQLLVGAVAIEAVHRSWPSSALAWLGGLYNSITSLVVGFLLLVVLLAPTGRALNTFYRWVTRMVVVATTLWFLASIVLGLDGSSLPGGPTGVRLAPDDWLPWVWLLSLASMLVVVAGSLLAIVGLGMRYVRSRGETRRQVTWVVAGGLGGIVVLWAQGLLSPWLPDAAWVGSFAWAVGPSLLPLGIAVAVLRHGLYELDSVVSRTVSYAIVTGVVVAIYAVLVTGISQLVQGADNLAVAAATLAAAASVRPVLRRVRNRVDRQFNRTRFDAEHAVHEFGTTLRTVVDPDHVAAELRDVLVRTIQPAGLAIWLRSSP